MEYRKLGNSDLEVSALGLGTWVTGGWLWGGADDAESEKAIETSIEGGVTLIDTAPVYGFGRSEEVVGRVIKRMNAREKVILATKCGLEWDDKQRIRRHSSKKRILQEIDDSRRRLQMDVIDLYQVHWPDEGVAWGETMETLNDLYEKGVIRAIGVSNFDVAQMTECLKYAPIHSLQPPYNLFEPEIEAEILPFCQKNNIGVLAYGSICRGLLSGKFKVNASFKDSDVRHYDERFQPENIQQYLDAVEGVRGFAKTKSATPAQMAIRWTAEQPGITVALVGARTSQQAKDNEGAFSFDFQLQDSDTLKDIVSTHIKNPVPRKFMGPPPNKSL